MPPKRDTSKKRDKSAGKGDGEKGEGKKDEGKKGEGEKGDGEKGEGKKGKKGGKSKEKQSKEDQLLHTKKYDEWKETSDLYSLPVTAVPGCGYFLGYLLKRQGIFRASDLHAEYQKQKEDKFTKWLSCKFGAWNQIYAKTIITAFKDWEELQKKKEKKDDGGTKGTHKVGPGSKKWDEFMKKDLNKVSVKAVPGIATTLGCLMCRRGIKTAQQLMDYWQNNCKKDEKEFSKWIKCICGYWNTLYTKTALDALIAYEDQKSQGKKGKKGKKDNKDKKDNKEKKEKGNKKKEAESSDDESGNESSVHEDSAAESADESADDESAGEQQEERRRSRRSRQDDEEAAAAPEEEAAEDGGAETAAAGEEGNDDAPAEDAAQE